MGVFPSELILPFILVVGAHLAVRYCRSSKGVSLASEWESYARLLLAGLVFLIIHQLTLGTAIYDSGSAIVSVKPGSPAAEAGLLPGDRLEERAGMRSWEYISRQLGRGESPAFSVLRSTEQGEVSKNITITPPPGAKDIIGLGGMLKVVRWPVSLSSIPEKVRDLLLLFPRSLFESVSFPLVIRSSFLDALVFVLFIYLWTIPFVTVGVLALLHFAPSLRGDTKEPLWDIKLSPAHLYCAAGILLVTSFSIGVAQSGAIYRDWQFTKERRNKLSVSLMNKREIEAHAYARGDIRLVTFLKVEIGADVPVEEVKSFLDKQGAFLPQFPGYQAFGKWTLDSASYFSAFMKGGDNPNPTVSNFYNYGEWNEYNATYRSFQSEGAKAEGVLEIPLTGECIGSLTFVSGFSSRVATDVRCEMAFEDGTTVPCGEAPLPGYRPDFVTPGNIRYQVGGDIRCLHHALKKSPLAVRFRYRWVDHEGA